MREAGTGPDIVLFQEMFSDSAKRAVRGTGYPAIRSGPRRTTNSKGSTRQYLPGHSSLKRGEIGIHVFGSGLAIASRWSIVDYSRRAYGRRSCAGFDCLSNKGIALARIEIPGVPSPIDVYDTHMNSRGASGAPAARNLAAHDRQAQEASQFIDETHDDEDPLIFGGDFNMRHSEPRWENFSKYQSLDLVHRICASPVSGCEVKMSWDGDEPWMDTQDLQFLWTGDEVKIRPVKVEAMFDGSPDSPVLSDHDGFMVTYELRWKASLTRTPSCAPLSRP
jgi:endonuclease/exonuclease/phosphatase family metal-dependent hydrolase